MKIKKHFRKYRFYYILFGIIGLFLIGFIVLKIIYPEIFYYDAGWRWEK